MMKAQSSAMPRFFSSLSISGRVGMTLVVFWVLIALIGPSISPHDGNQVVSQDVFLGSSLAFPLGTDYLGRDMLSRILYGTRYTVGLALTSAVLASCIGLGLFSTVNGPHVDAFISRIIDALISIPSKMLALVIVAAFGSSIQLLITIAALSYMPGAFRIARSLAVNLQTLEYVQVARVRGEGRFYIAWREILPNMVHPMLADFGLRFVFIVLLLSGLSFLGLGVQPPNADLGSLVRENISGLGQGALAVIAPSFAIATLTVGVNILIDSLPRLGLRTGGKG